MLDLLAHLGRDRAIWVGHDWAAPVVWSLASHHPEHCSAVGVAPRDHEVMVGCAAEKQLPLLDRMYKEYSAGAAPPVLEELAQLYAAPTGLWSWQENTITASIRV
jgi:pimeloyl-ACP methyl ester carboxylesterase